MNILILSVGTRIKIVHYFKNALGKFGRVIATDMSELAPAVYVADKFYKVPCITDENYISIILEICKKEDIKGVLSLIDPELSLLAQHKDKFYANGVMVIGADYKQCDRAFNKMYMYEWLKKNNYNCARSYVDKESFYHDVVKGVINYPVFVKPICGSASVATTKVYDRQTIEMLYSHSDDLMIQEYLNGQEIGADVYVDMISGEVVSVFTKKKILMRAGETNKAVSFKDDKLFALIEKFVMDSGWLGQLDIDIFLINGEYYISEVNPRFGGGYPHAYECGCDHMSMIINNINGVVNKKQIGCYEENVYMMKYNEVTIKKQSDLTYNEL